MSDLQSDAVFAAIKDRVAADPAKAKSVNGVFAYKITKDGAVKKEWSKNYNFRLVFRVQSAIIFIEIEIMNICGYQFLSVLANGLQSDNF